MPENQPEDPWREKQESLKSGVTPLTESQWLELVAQQETLTPEDIPPYPWPAPQPLPIPKPPTAMLSVQPSAPVPPDETNPKLFRRTDRLARFHRWLNEDPELAEVFDSVLKEQVKAASRRQALISVAVAIVSLIVGWLLNAINPLSLANLLHH